jgi:hypothetical protein
MDGITSAIGALPYLRQCVAGFRPRRRRAACRQTRLRSNTRCRNANSRLSGILSMRDTGFEPAVNSPFLEESANRLSQIPSLKDLRGLELCEVIAAWPDLPEALRAGVLAIVRTQSRDLSINRGSESANGAKVAAVRAAKRQSSVAGAKPEQPVCGRGAARTLETRRHDKIKIAASVSASNSEINAK